MIVNIQGPRDEAEIGARMISALFTVHTYVSAPTGSRAAISLAVSLPDDFDPRDLCPLCGAYLTQDAIGHGTPPGDTSQCRRCEGIWVTVDGLPEPLTAAKTPVGDVTVNDLILAAGDYWCVVHAVSRDGGQIVLTTSAAGHDNARTGTDTFETDGHLYVLPAGAAGARPLSGEVDAP